MAIEVPGKQVDVPEATDASDLPDTNEPAPDAGTGKAVRSRARRFAYAHKYEQAKQYPLPSNQASPNAEGLIVDPSGGNTFMPTSTRSGQASVPGMRAASEAGNYGPPTVPVNEYVPLVLNTNEAAPFENEYLPLAREAKAAPQQALKGALFTAKDTQPDQQAKILQIADTTQTPPAIVARNLPEYEKRASLAGNDYEDLIKNSPATAGFLMNPENAKLAHDDIKQLSYLERQFQHIGQQFKAGQQTVELSDIGTAALMGKITPEQRRRQKEIQEILAKQEPQGIDGFIEGIPGAVANQGPIFARTLKGAATGMIAGAGVGAITGGGAGLVFGGAPAIPGAIAGAGTGAFLGYRVGSAIEAAKMEGSLAYLELEKEKDDAGQALDRSTMLGAAMAVGAINGSLEAIGFASVLQAAPGFKAFQRGGIKQILNNPTTRAAFLKAAKAIGTGTATEGITEGLQSIVGSLAQTFAVSYQNGELPKWDTKKILEALEKAAMEARAGAQAGAGMTTVTAGASLTLDVREVRKADKTVEAYNAIGETATNSKLNERMPEAFNELAAAAAKDGPVENIYIPMEAAVAYFQSKNLDIEQVVDELGVRKDYEAAKAAGGDIKIPLATWVSKVVRTEHYKGLADDVKFDPEGMTRRQVKERTAEIEGEVQNTEAAAQAQEDARVEQEERSARAESVSKIYQDLQAKLKAAGVSSEEAKFNPKLHEAFFGTLAARMGVDPLELQKQFPLDVRKGDVGEGAGVIDTSFEFGAEEAGGQAVEGASSQDALLYREVSQGAKGDLMQMARRAIQAIPDVPTDEVADALGLPRNQVRLLGSKSRRKAGKLGTYSKEQILEAAQTGEGENHPTSLFQSERPPAPAFYSRLTRTVEEKMGGSASVEQINGMLKEIKPEERKWLGLDDFLKGKQKVSKAELLAHLQGNQVEITEVTKADAVEEGRETEEGIAYDEIVDRTKFSGYTLPGGENYREVLFTLPGKPNPIVAKLDELQTKAFELEHEGKQEEADAVHAEALRLSKENGNVTVGDDAQTYRSSHFEEANVLAHTRLNDRTDADGKRVLFVEEIQSDWHQAGRKKGYADPNQPELTELPAGYDVEEYKPKLVFGNGEGQQETYWQVTSPEGRIVIGNGPTREAVTEMAIKKLNRESKTDKVPDAPFRKTWHEFVLKRLIREAAEKGYDRVAWTTGEQQAERYDLSKQIDSINYGPNAETKGKKFDIIVNVKGQGPTDYRGKTPEQLEELIGKELTQKIVAGEGGKSSASKMKVLDGLDLKVGGEGMKGFYDKILVDFANKFGKKYGAKVGETKLKAGQDAEALARENQRQQQANVFTSISVADVEKTVSVHSLEITPELKAAALNEGFALFQGGDAPRGRIVINGREFRIDLFAGSDESTFLHETGHYFLEVMKNVAATENAPLGIREDFATLKDWLGVKDGEAITVEQHEKFARGFELYLRSGEAPSLSLRNAFHRFAKWLTELYKQASRLEVEISPAMKRVFDRMVATEEEIAQAEREVKWVEDTFPELDEKSREEIFRLREKARIQVENDLLKEKLEQTKDAYREELAAETKKLRAEAEEAVKRQPLFAAIEQLRTGTGKRRNPYELAEKGLAGKLKLEESALFELLAEEHGFASADELAQAVAAAGAENQFKTEVELLVNDGLRQSGKLKDTAQLREDALRTLHDESMTEVMALEREALLALAAGQEIRDEVRIRNRQAAKLEALAASNEAARLIALKPAKEAGRPGIYITMERNAAARVARFQEKKDYEAAAKAKREQMVAHALVRESFRVNKEVGRHINYIEQFTNRKQDLLGMPFGFVRQIDDILVRFGVQEQPAEDPRTMIAIATAMEGRGESDSEIANATGLERNARGGFEPETLSSFLARVNEDHKALIIPSIIENSTDVDFEQLTLPELRDLREAVQLIAQAGRFYDRWLTNTDKLTIGSAALELRMSIEKLIGMPHEGDFKFGAGEEQGLKAALKAIGDLPDRVIPSMVNVETLVRFLDRKDPNGPARRFIYRPMADAENRKQVIREKAIADLNAIMEKYYKPEELAAYKTEKRYSARGLPNTLTKENILAMALNWGNETNRDRVMNGYKKQGITLSEGDVNDIFEALDERDWNFVQDTWDFLDSFWPEIARLEMKVKGVEPIKVKAAQVVTKFGVKKGGYYPIAYDFGKSAEAYINAEQRAELYKGFSAAGAQTDRGHAQARVARVNRPVRLSLGVMFDHLENVVHDIAYREAVIDVARMLKEKDTAQAIQNAVGLKGFMGLNQWLSDIASDQRESLQDGEQLFRWFRGKATFSMLGVRAVTVPMDIMGNVINTTQERGAAEGTKVTFKMTAAAVIATVNAIGPKRLGKAIADYAYGEAGRMEPTEISSYMKSRENLLDRDLADLHRRWQGKESSLATFAFFFQRFSDQAVSRPLWNEVYKDALSKYTEKEAVHIADETIKRTMGSGARIDLVGAQRGSEFKKIFTMFYSWSSMMFNRAWLEGKIAGLEYREGNHLAALAVGAKAAFFLWGLHAVNESFWREFFYNAKDDDADEEKRKKRILTRIASQPFGYLWIGRDISALAISTATTGRGDYRPSPVFGALETVVGVPAKGVYFAFTDPKKLNQKYLEDSARTASILLGSPQTLNSMAFNFIDWANNNGQATWRDALTRRKKD